MEQDTPTTEKPALTSRDFAALLGISAKTFYKWRAAGRFSGLELERLPKRWSRAKVTAWLTGQTVSERRRTRVA